MIASFGKQVVNLARWVVLCGILVFATNVPVVVGQTVIAKTVAPPAVSAPPLARVPAEPAAPAAADAGDTTDAPLVVSGLEIDERSSTTTFTLALSKSIEAHIFTLADPYRIVIDMPEVAFHVPAGPGQDRKGLIAAVRYGLFAAGRSRVVITTLGPVRVARFETVEGPTLVALRLQLVPTGVDEFAAQATTRQAAAATLRPTLGPSTPEPARQPAGGKFVIMIDPGHGGIDAGAVSAEQAAEKDVVLAVALQLRSALDSKRYDVRMTRVSDTFVSLDKRVALSEAAGAGLFVSLHADAVEDAALARSVRGATVYTLSERASNDVARALADKENAADVDAGLVAVDAAEHGQVNTILADLAKRETQGFSAQFQHILVERMRIANMLGRDPSRAAAFRVLRQAQTPTVLIELGFISHPVDAAQMRLVDWQKRTAATIAAAIDAYAAVHSGR